MTAIRPRSTSRFVRMRLALSAALATVCAVPCLTTRPAMADPAPPTRGQIYRQLGVDAVPADYVVLVDTSGSMAGNGRYSNVRRVLGTFLSGLAHSDYVALYTFDSGPQRRYGGSAGNRNAILNALPAGPTPNGKTDIGSGIEQALNELNRAGAASIATVVMLTDGQQDAPANSAYRSTTSPAWQRLRARAASLKKTWLGAFALPLMAQTGASLLQKVIPSTVVLEPSTGPALASYLDQSKQTTRLAKARSLLAGDLGKGVRVAWTATQSDAIAGTTTLQANLTSLTQRVPVTVSDLHVNARDGVTWSGSLPSAVVLKPGQTRSFILRVRWNPDFSFKLWPHQVPVSAPMSLAGRVDSPWAAALAPEIALNVPRQITNSGNVRVSIRVGSWRAVEIVGGVLALILLALALALYIRAFPRLPAGAIGVYEVGAGPNEGFRRIDQFPVGPRRVAHASRAADATISVRGRRISASLFAAQHIGLETTLARNDSRGTSRHTIRPGHGGLIGGFYLLHVQQGDDVPTRLRVNNDPEESTEGSPWSTTESHDSGFDAIRSSAAVEPSNWADNLGDTRVPASGDNTA